MIFGSFSINLKLTIVLSFLKFKKSLNSTHKTSNIAVNYSKIQHKISWSSQNAFCSSSSLCKSRQIPKDKICMETLEKLWLRKFTLPQHRKRISVGAFYMLHWKILIENFCHRSKKVNIFRLNQKIWWYNFFCVLASFFQRFYFLYFDSLSGESLRNLISFCVWSFS